MFFLLGSFVDFAVIWFFCALFLKSATSSALSLACAFFSAGAFLIAIGADLYGFVLMAVYVGAIVIMFLFAALSTNETQSVRFKNRIPFVVSIFLTFIAVIVSLFMKGDKLFGSDFSLRFLENSKGSLFNIHSVAKFLYFENAPAFVGVAVLLLTATVGFLSFNVLCDDEDTVKIKSPCSHDYRNNREILLKDMPSGSGLILDSEDGDDF